LTSIIVPFGVTTIGDNAFYNCYGLKSITIPKSVTIIGIRTFSECGSLASITIPESITTIGALAFSNCSGLNKITVNWTSTPPSINSNVFSGLTPSQIALYIPKGTKHIYELADVWNLFRLVTDYVLNIGTFTGGNVTADQSVYNEGDLVTLTITPTTDYIFGNISAYKTGEASTTIALSGTGNERTFTMPEYDVTIEASFRNPDMEAVNAAQGLIEASTYSLTQSEGNTEEAVKIWLAAQINALAGITTMGVDPVTESAITISAFTAAVTGGADGNFEFTVSLSKSNATAITASLRGTITATPIVNAETPVISGHPQNIAIDAGGSVTLTVTAGVNDGGTLSYRWYSNTSNSNAGGSLINGATGNNYSPPTTSRGTMWYYAVVTNTNNRVNGTQTAGAASHAASVTINTYQITVAPTNNGSVEATPESAVAGESATLTVVPATDYVLDNISAYKTGEVGTIVALSGIGNSRSFVMPAFGVTIEATFKTMPPNGIADVFAPKTSIYPNPVKHTMYIQSESPIEKVEIYTQEGILVLVDKAYDGKTDVSYLPAGIYFVRVYVNDTVETKKVIVRE
jgi:hypothetical protein